MRVGHGFDIHAFGKGDHIILGGVRISYNQGLIAHSDGDVLLHAICDALLGAANLGDIGRYFPACQELLGVSSRFLLRTVYALVLDKNFTIGNVDTTIIAQLPRVGAYNQLMCKNIAEDLNIQLSNVNVKSTTTDHLGCVGRCEGIAAHAVVMLF